MSAGSNSFPEDFYWEHFINALSEPVLILNLNGIIVYANESACQLFDKKQEDLLKTDFSYPIETTQPIEIEILNRNQTIIAEMTVKSGSWKREDAWVVTLHDITKIKKTEEKLKISANVFNFAKEGIVITDTSANIIDINKEFTHITGYEKKDIIGKHIKLLQSGKQDKSFYEKMWHSIKEKGFWYGEIWNKKSNGEIYPELLAISEVRDDADEVIYYVGVFYDISLQEEQKQQLQQVAHYDTLTKLPNRLLFTSQLAREMKVVKRSQQYLAIGFIDIDDFKTTNDQYGHDVGDLLLKAVAKIFTKCMRQEDVIARYGGDEFVLLMTKLNSFDEYQYIIDRIYNKLSKPITIKSFSIKANVSIGITSFPQKEMVSPEQLIRRADQAMYVSKVSGKGRCTLFDMDIDIQNRQRNSIINELVDAFHNDEFKLYYQPQVNMVTNEVLGVEGLLRWQHPTKGLLFPGQFLGVLRRDKFLLELTEWTISEALRQIRAWDHLNKNLTISINIDAFQIEQVGFINKLRELISDYTEQEYRRLELEILESSFITKINKIYKIIKKCNDMGIDFLLDDFGTGFSSINYLLKLPFKYMKIDMNFIRNMLGSERDIKIVKAILQIAQADNIAVIAEGVETAEHVKLLVGLGCEYGQGFAFSKALPAAEFAIWYEGWKK
jgi:diguanylate cyclase (GGDEF)-like protein/PAS domain S-box-containing protein